MDLPSLEATARLGRQIAASTQAGQLVILSGQLGTGKTTLMQAIAAALGSDAVVTSPTYTLVHEYPSPEGRLIHIDAYRLGSAEALIELGLDDYLDRARLVVVEWGEALLNHYPEARLLRLYLDDEGRRWAESEPPLSS